MLSSSFGRIVGVIAFYIATSVVAQTLFPYNDRNNYFIEPPRASIDTVYNEAVTYRVGEKKTFRWVANFTYPVDVYLYQENGNPTRIGADITTQSLDWNGQINIDSTIGRIFFVSLFNKQSRYLMRSQYINFNSSVPASSSSSSASSTSSTTASSQTATATSATTPSAAAAGSASSSASASSGTSNNKKVALGAGLGVGLGGAALLAVGILLLWRRKRRQSAPRKSVPEVQQLPSNGSGDYLQPSHYR